MNRINPLRRKLEAGGTGAGVLVTMPSVNLTQVLAASGFDYLFIDMEHGPIDVASAHHLIQATAGTDCAPLVRVSKPDLALTKPVLDSGAMGMIFPMVNDRATAEATVRATRYPPEGERGWGPFYAPARWGLDGAVSYFERANAEILNIALIEHIDAIENIDEIVSVPGIDVAAIAPMDLSVSMGLPGQREHPDILAAIKRAETAILGAGLWLGGMALSVEEANAKIEAGYRFLILGYDVMLIERAAHGALHGIKREPGPQ